MLPEYQRKGIGSELMRWTFAELGLDKKLVWIWALMDARNVYRRYGWKDVEYFDVDMAQWGGKNRGFGALRTTALLRQPGAWKRSEGVIDD